MREQRCFNSNELHVYLDIISYLNKINFKKPAYQWQISYFDWSRGKIRVYLLYCEVGIATEY